MKLPWYIYPYYDCLFLTEIVSALCLTFSGSPLPGENKPGSNRDVLLATAGATTTYDGQRTCQDEGSHT